MSADVDGNPDPFREQLDSRWQQYLSTGLRAQDHDRWVVDALSMYRDEIVHYGAQLLNDLAIRPWHPGRAKAGFKKYQEAARSFDANPRAWEIEFWARLRDEAPAGLYSRFDGQIP